MPSSRGSSRPRDRTQVSRIAGGFFTSWATREGLGPSLGLAFNWNLNLPSFPGTPSLGRWMGLQKSRAGVQMSRAALVGLVQPVPVLLRDPRRRGASCSAASEGSNCPREVPALHNVIHVCPHKRDLLSWDSVGAMCLLTDTHNEWGWNKRNNTCSVLGKALLIK